MQGLVQLLLIATAALSSYQHVEASPLVERQLQLQQILALGNNGISPLVDNADALLTVVS